MRVAIYARVSTDDKGQDPSNQLRELRDYASRQEGWTVAHDYTDRASGKSGEREQFQAMLRDAARHRFDVLLFWSLDRLTREGTFRTLLYLRQLTDAGVKYRSHTEPYLDTLGLWGEAIAGVLATVAKQESIRLSERVRAGMARAKAEGTHCGRPRKKLNLARIRNLREKGLTYSIIARKMRTSPAVIWKRLHVAG